MIKNIKNECPANCIVRAVKAAQDQNGMIVRVNEGSGQARKNVKLKFYKKIENDNLPITYQTKFTN